jgi:hypothetical protein
VLPAPNAALGFDGPLVEAEVVLVGQNAFALAVP